MGISVPFFGDTAAKGSIPGAERGEEFGGGGNVFDDLGGVRTDADVTKVWKFPGPFTAFVGDIECVVEHAGHVAFGVEGQLVEASHRGQIFTPTRVTGVDRLERLVEGNAAGDVAADLAVGGAVGGADEKFALPVAVVGEGVELVDRHAFESRVAQGVSFFHRVEPTDHPLSPGRRAVFEFFQDRAQGMGIVHLGDKGVGADFGVVGFGRPDGVNWLSRDAAGQKEFRGEGVGGGDVGRKSVPLVEPVGLPEFSQDEAVFSLCPQDQFAHVAYVVVEGESRFPVGFDQLAGVDGERLFTFETVEVELALGKDPAGDTVGVGAGFSLGQDVEKLIPGRGVHLANVADAGQGALHPLGETFREKILRPAEIREVDLPLAGLIPVGRRNAASGGAARLFLKNMGAVMFPGEVEQAVGKVGHHGSLVDGQAGENAVAALFERMRFPPDFSRIGNDAAPEGEMGDLCFHHPRREQIQFQAARGVAGVGSAVHLQNHGDAIRALGGIAQLFRDFGDEAPFALIAHADADIGDKFAREWN